MKNSIIYFAVAATCLLAACAKKEAPVQEASANLFYIQAQGGEATKAAIDNTSAAFTWSAGDQIAVYTTDGYKKSVALTEGGSASASFAFDEDIDDARADFALFPANLVFDGDSPRGCASEHTTSELDIVLPDSYTLAQVQGDASPVFMVAANAPGDALAFKQMGALLRIKVQYIPKDAQTLKVTFPGQKVQGLFALFDFAAGDGIPAEDGDEDTITITDLGISEFTDALIINIPVPCGVDAKYVRVGAYDSTDHKINSIDVPIKEVESVPTAWKPARKAARKVIASLPYFTSNTKNNKKVVFAPGNLQATLTKKATASQIGEANNWRFAEHQYDALGDCAGNRLETAGESVDLFAWVGSSSTQEYTDAQKYGLLYPTSSSATTWNAWHGNSNSDVLKFNWASLFNGDSYPANTWRLPGGKVDGETLAEGWRLFQTRNSSYVSAKAIILNVDGAGKDVPGLILFPDTYVHPYGVKDLVNYNQDGDANKNSHYSDNQISLEEWNLLENVGGCVFLPVTSARYRFKDTDNKYYSNTAKHGGEAAYWNDLSASNATQAAALVVSDTGYLPDSGFITFDGKTNTAPNKSVTRCNGLAVRLIRDVN